MPLPHSVRESINSFVINQCLDFPVEKLETLIKYPDYILLTLYGFKSSRNVCEDSLFLSKLWNSPREESRTDLLEAVWILHSGENGNQDFIPNLSSIWGKDFFPPSSTFCYPELQRQFVFNNQYSSLLGDRHHEGAPFIVPVSDHQEKPSNAGYGPLLEVYLTKLESDGASLSN
ncbi:unnamed protein product [Allacma fusca]|uniref:Uncharacterized protein n=1 Tax=Allacma fusca TaxID=39272 RepID=A0A8J2PU83_9HEXA|nr:unnamed protein product [Allacma fusca]